MLNRQPENIKAVTCYYNQYFFVLSKKNTSIKEQTIQYLKIDRVSQQIVLNNNIQTILKNFQKKGFKERKFSAFLGILDICNQKFLLFCQQSSLSSSIQKVQIFEINSLYFMGYTQQRILKKKQNKRQIYRNIRDYYLILKKGFYFSNNYNITRKFTEQQKDINQRYAWNYQMLKQLTLYKANQWKIAIIQGFARSFEVYLEGIKLGYVLISRRSNKKGGPRYFDRGLDDMGYVANFCQTQQIIRINQYYISDLQIRGSIPIFFEQIGLTTKTRINRGMQLTHDVFKKHIQRITKQYERVFFVNLLSVGKKGQKLLTQQLQSHFKQQVNPNIKYLYYDFHQKVRGGKYENVDQIIKQLAIYKLNLRYHILNSKNGQVLSNPSGVFRTNCLDCLDRTNFFQAKLALITFQAILSQFKICQRNLLQQMRQNYNDNDLIKKFRNIWADNGDAISMHYTGTGSTHTDITRDGQRGWLGNFKHKYKSITRFYNQNFWDFYKMRLVNLLLNHQQKTKYSQTDLQKILKQRQSQYIQKINIQIYIFSWKAPKIAPKSLVLLPNEHGFIVVDIQDAGEDDRWQKLIDESVDKEKYILVQGKRTSNNILKIYARKQLKNAIKFVQNSKVKFNNYYNTLVSNKCANIIRIGVLNTKITFIGCQLQKGQLYNQNRIKNIRQIHEKAFQSEQVGRTKSTPIDNDDIIFLFGNLNTTIQSKYKQEIAYFNNLSINETSLKLIQKMIETDDYQQIRQGLIQFREYQEQTIRFLPTYKYINGSFDKQCSGWPDRILYSSNNKIKCLRYDVIQQLRKQHVPVVGTFQVQVDKINQQMKQKICQQFMDKSNNISCQDITEEQQKLVIL